MYDIKKGIIKGIKFILIGLGSVAIITGFSEVSLWGLLEQYLKPLLGSLTIGGILVILQNYVKIKFGGMRGLLGLKNRKNLI